MRLNLLNNLRYGTLERMLKIVIINLIVDVGLLGVPLYFYWHWHVERFVVVLGSFVVVVDVDMDVVVVLVRVTGVLVRGEELGGFAAAVGDGFYVVF